MKIREAIGLGRGNVRSKYQPIRFVYCRAASIESQTMTLANVDKFWLEHPNFRGVLQAKQWTDFRPAFSKVLRICSIFWKSAWKSLSLTGSPRCSECYREVALLNSSLRYWKQKVVFAKRRAASEAATTSGGWRAKQTLAAAIAFVL